MDNLQESPVVDPIKLALSKVLAKLRGATTVETRALPPQGGNPMEHRPMGPPVETNFSPLDFGGMSKELENQAYGNSPLRNNLMGGPIFKPGRDESMMALAGAVPMGGPAKLATVFPVGAATILRKTGLPAKSAIDTAEKMLAEGKTANEIWQATHLDVIPRSKLGTPRSPYDNKWGQEIMSDDAGFVPDALMSRTQKLRQLLRREDYDEMYNVKPDTAFANPPKVEALKTTTQGSPWFAKNDFASAKNRIELADYIRNTDMLRPGSRRLDEVWHDPELYAHNPKFRDITVIGSRDIKPGSGKVVPGKDMRHSPITIAADPGLQPKGLRGVVTHEIQHQPQLFEDMPIGGNDVITALGREDVSILSNTLRNNKHLANNSEVGPLLNNILDMTQGSAYSRYRGLLGERQSANAEARDAMPKEVRARIAPSTGYVNKANNFSVNTVNEVNNKLRKTFGTGKDTLSEADLQSITKTLRKLD